MIQEAWRDRLLDAIGKDPRRPRALSLDAKLGPNYVGQMIRKGKRPGAATVLKLCRALKVSPTYIFSGARMSPEEEELIVLIQSMTDDDRKVLLDLAKKLRRDDEPHS